MTGSGRPVLVVVDVGWGTTVQDVGRPGLAHVGVPTAGAVDRRTHELVNRLAGNAAGAATLETLGGLVVEAVEAVVVARSTDSSRHTLRPGERLRVDPAVDHLWGYLAVRGGIDVDVVLGSRSHDTLSGIGPPPLAAGVGLAAGHEPSSALAAELAPTQRDERPVRLWPGPQADWFAGGIDLLVGGSWTVGSDVSRVGARLVAGDFPRRRPADAMPSAGLVPGAVQITPSGEPIVMLANHPTTGGYPVIAVVDPDDLPLVAQTRPGSHLRFRA
jgi:biotin-dependent carboxylase-like uncharacterized protein